MPKRIATELAGEIMVKRPHSGAGSSPSEQAAVVAMAAQGESTADIARELDRCGKWVARRREELASRIEELRLEVREDCLEDYNDILMLAHLEVKERLMDPERVQEISAKDLTGIARHYFNMRQIMASQPTQITDTRGGQVLDVLVLARETDQNFEAAMRALVSRGPAELTGEIVDAEFVEVPGNKWDNGDKVGSGNGNRQPDSH